MSLCDLAESRREAHAAAPQPQKTSDASAAVCSRAWVGGGAGFAWTPRRRRALELVGNDELTDEAIARSLGICRRTLSTWKAAPPFQAELQRRCAAWEQELHRAVQVRWLRRCDSDCLPCPTHLHQGSGWVVVHEFAAQKPKKT